MGAYMSVWVSMSVGERRRGDHLSTNEKGCVACLKPSRTCHHHHQRFTVDPNDALSDEGRTVAQVSQAVDPESCRDDSQRLGCGQCSRAQMRVWMTSTDSTDVHLIVVLPWLLQYS